MAINKNPIIKKFWPLISCPRAHQTTWKSVSLAIPVLPPQRGSWRPSTSAFDGRRHPWWREGDISVTRPEVFLFSGTSRSKAKLWTVTIRPQRVIAVFISYQLKQVKNCKIVREIWLKLEAIFEYKNPIRLRRKLITHRMEKNGDVVRYFNEFFNTK